MTSPVACSSPWGRSKTWSPIKHSSMDQHHSDPGSPWLINTWLLLITSVHMHSRSSMRKKTKKKTDKKRGFCEKLTVSVIYKPVLDFGSLCGVPACLWRQMPEQVLSSLCRTTHKGERDFSAKCWRPLMLMTFRIQHKMCFQKLKTQIKVVYA